MYQIMSRMYRFLLRKVIHLLGKFFDKDSEMTNKHRTLFEWCDSKRRYEPEIDSDDKYSLDFV